MKSHRSLLALSCCLIAGCVSTTVVTTPEHLTEINALGKEYHATITVQVDSAVYNFPGDFTAIDNDSVRWINPCTGKMRSAPTAKLQRIRFFKSVKGALEGFAFVAGPGIVIAAAVNGALGGFLIVVGGGIGAAVGALNGHSTDYIFRTP